MPNKEQCDKFAAEMAQRFEDFAKWAIDNWPHKNAPLLQSDLTSSRREIAFILGSKLTQSEAAGEASSSAGDTAQYINQNPAPWP